MIDSRIDDGEMEEPCQCECGELFDLKDGYDCDICHEIICPECYVKHNGVCETCEDDDSLEESD